MEECKRAKTRKKQVDMGELGLLKILSEKHRVAGTPSFASSNEQVGALLSPKNVAIVGASERPGAWGGRVWNNLRKHGYPYAVYPINPTREEVWGVKCYPGFDALPEAPDHIAIMVPAAQVPDVITKAAAAGARSATIFSAGFGEGAGEDGLAIRDALSEVIAKTGLGVSGPNCVGNFSVEGSFVTLIEDRKQSLRRGGIALVGQSGGSLMALNQCLEGRGLHVDYLVTSGNEIGLKTADYIAYFATRSQVRVIVVYIEHIADAERLLAAARLATDAGKIVVAYKLGHSDAGREAALAHTGTLAGSVQGFDAVFGSRGIVRVDTLDDLIEVSELVTRSGIPRGSRLGAVTLSGAFRGILLDTADRAGVTFPSLAAVTEEKLKGILSTGSYAGNPIDGGFSLVSNPNVLTQCLDALNDDPNIDFILVQGSIPREAGSPRAEKYIGLTNAFAEGGNRKPIAFTSFASYGLTEYALGLRSQAPKVSFLQEAYKSLCAVGRVGAGVQARALREQDKERPSETASSAEKAKRMARVADLIGKKGGQILNEADAKTLLASYGIKSPAERVVGTLDDALRAAAEIGYPVVLKLLSSEVLHKSDIGGVQLGIRTPDELRTAFDTLRANVQRHGVRDEGYLVAQFVEGGVEMALGIHNDPEVGPLVMAGAGGVLLELIKDVEFGAPPISLAMANAMVDRLKSKKLLTGFRGKPPLDIGSFCLAITQLATLAAECGDLIQSIDINPLVVLPNGCLALDAAIVLKGNQSSH